MSGDRFTVEVGYGGKDVEITDERFEPTTGYSPGCLHNETTYLAPDEARRFALAINIVCDQIDAGGIRHDGCDARAFLSTLCAKCGQYAYPSGSPDGGTR